MMYIKRATPTQLGLFFLLIMATWLFVETVAVSASIPEPETLLYGKVINRSGGQDYLLTEGKLEWNISDHETTGKTFSFVTKLEALGDGQFSYQLRIPHEAALAGQIVSSGVVPLSSEEMRYDHTSVTINGIPASIIAPASDYVTFKQGARMTPYRIDLEVVFELSDSDEDGMPDWWEDKYGLDKNNPDDADDDPDADGASNLAEYLSGSDPTVLNLSPMLTTARVSIYESAITVIFLETHDSDSAPANITYTLTRAPEGGTLYLRDNSGSPDIYGLNTGRILTVNDIFTQEDVNQGRLQFSHDDVTVTDISFDLSVADETPGHQPAAGTITADIIRPTAQDGTEASLWLDANYEASQHAELTVWKDRSGPKEWTDGSSAPFDMSEVHGNAVSIAPEGPYQKPALVFNSALFKGPAPDEAAVLKSGVRTLFAVFKADGTEDQKVLNTPDFELAVAGENDGHAGQLRYGTAKTSVYTSEPVTGKWVLATVQSRENEAVMEINGWWAGGPGGVEEDNALGRTFTLGGANISRFDMTQGVWATDETDIFTGRMAEILAFDYQIPNAQRQRIAWQLLSKWFGYVIYDGSASARNQSLITPAERPYVIIGGPGDDTIYGGAKDDILSGGQGDDLLTGGAGSDLFIFNDLLDGNDTIADFSVAQGDVIDLTGILSGTSTLISDYIKITPSGSDCLLQIDADGQGSDYSDMVIRIKQNMFGNDYLPYLWGSGGIIAGTAGFPLQVGVRATMAETVEGSEDSAVFTIDFTGEAIPEGLLVPFALTGTAQWKTDYLLEARLYNTETGLYELTQLQNLSVPVRLKYGDRALEIHVTALADTETEGIEDVALTLSKQEAWYDLAATPNAAVSISDGPVPVTITALRGSLDEGSGIGDELTISRSGPVDVALDVLLTITGGAVNGSDYSFIPEKITIPEGESLIKIRVKAYMDQTVEPVETIEILIEEGAGYVPGDPANAVMRVIDPENTVEETPVTGNLNNDSVVDLEDAILALQISAGITPPALVYYEADVNGDSRLGPQEAIYVLQVIAALRQ